MKTLYKIHAPNQPYLLDKFSKYLSSVGINEFIPVHVDHCPQSFAIVIGHQSKVKISYSGDCRPSK